MLEGGHAKNALPQTPRALVNCRIMPGEKFDDIKATLIQVLEDEQIAVKQVGDATPSDPAVIDELLTTIEKTRPTACFYATPASRPTATRGSRAMSTTCAHGKDERVAAKSFFDGWRIPLPFCQAAVRRDIGRGAIMKASTPITLPDALGAARSKLHCSFDDAGTRHEIP
jgi:hypothetical protein